MKLLLPFLSKDIVQAAVTAIEQLAYLHAYKGN
jgi:hypothetical protein